MVLVLCCTIHKKFSKIITSSTKSGWSHSCYYDVIEPQQQLRYDGVCLRAGDKRHKFLANVLVRGLPEDEIKPFKARLHDPQCSFRVYQHVDDPPSVFSLSCQAPCSLLQCRVLSSKPLQYSDENTHVEIRDKPPYFPIGSQLFWVEAKLPACFFCAYSHTVWLW